MANYITLSEFKETAELVGFSFADYDANRAIAAASTGIDEYTGRFFYQSSGTQAMFYEWGGARCLEIDDVVSVSTVQVDYDRDGTYETTWAQGTAFQLAPFNAAFTGKPFEELELLPLAVWRRPYWYPPLVKVTGVFGWPAVPEPVKEATTILAMRFVRRAREAPFGVVGLGTDNIAVRISRADSDVAFLLDPYMRDHGAMAA